MLIAKWRREFGINGLEIKAMAKDAYAKGARYEVSDNIWRGWWFEALEEAIVFYTIQGDEGLGVYEIMQDGTLDLRDLSDAK